MPANLALLRKVVMNLAKNERTHKKGIQAKRKRAAWDPPTCSRSYKQDYRKIKPIKMRPPC